MRAVRATGLGLGFVAVALVVAVTYQQTLAATDYRTDGRNPRVAAAGDRGSIVTADGVVVAATVDGVRTYPGHELYGHITGYDSPIFGAVAVERAGNELLHVEDRGSITAWLRDVLGGSPATGDIGLTVDDRLQRSAAEALDGAAGSVIVLDPATGAVLAMVSNPGFDPELLFGADALANGELLVADLEQPLVSRATGATFAPGSTFKVITAAAGMSEGGLEPTSLLEDTDELILPGSSATIRNADGEPCGDDRVVPLRTALVRSCNTTFGDMAMDLGAEALLGVASDAGLDAAIPFEVATVPGFLPDPETIDLPALAQTGIGERDVRVTPLHMAMVAAAVANDGLAMRPFLVAGGLSPDGELVDRTGPEEWRRLFPREIARALREMMVGVVEEGTGRNARVDGLEVGGKTGTPEVPGEPPHAWFIGFAEREDGARVAIVVFVESGGPLGEDASGGRVAAPIAAVVLESWSRQ